MGPQAYQRQTLSLQTPGQSGLGSETTLQLALCIRQGRKGHTADESIQHKVTRLSHAQNKFPKPRERKGRGGEFHKSRILPKSLNQQCWREDTLTVIKAFSNHQNIEPADNLRPAQIKAVLQAHSR